MYFSVVFLLRVFLTALALILAVMAFFAWKRRRLAPEAPIFALLILSTAIYSFGYAGEMAQTTLDRAWFWLHVEYFGVPWIPALWLLGALRHNNMKSHPGLLFAIPLITFSSQLTNSMHHLYDRSVTLVPRGPFWVVSVERGPIAWLNICYLVGALLYGGWIYISRSTNSGRSVTQRWIMVTASLVPLAGYLIYLIGYSPWGLDLAPSMLGVTVVLGYIAVFRYGYFDLVPMAQSLVFNNMRDAVLVADLQHRLVDFNPAAQELLPCLATARPGDDLEHVLQASPELTQIMLGPEGTHRLDYEVGGEKQQFHVRVFPLYRDKRPSGSAAILANITSQVRLMRELRHRAETDALTGVANRRSFLAAFKRERVRSARSQESFSLALVDLDRFKAINDRMGHQAGDSVLLAITGRMLQSIRGSDMLGRLGGDEFAILLPQTGATGAMEVTERIRAAVADHPVEWGSETVSASISIGLVTHESGEDTSLRELARRADMALYIAKARGCNTVVAWSRTEDSPHQRESAIFHP